MLSRLGGVFSTARLRDEALVRLLLERLSTLFIEIVYKDSQKGRRARVTTAPGTLSSDAADKLSGHVRWKAKQLQREQA